VVKRQAIFPGGNPSSGLPLSEGIRLGNLLFTSGAVGSDSDGNVPSDIRAQTRLALENLKTVLAAAGSGLEHVLKTTIYLTDINEFAAMNEVYRIYFTKNQPARTTVAVSDLVTPKMRIEIEMIAHIP
jgi:2-iminobutanoate/2-iminopropanoate deaminase